MCVYSLGGRVGVALNPVWPRPSRTEALTVTDKRQAPSVTRTWHRASFSLADAKSMTETLAGGRAGGPPHPAHPTPPHPTPPIPLPPPTPFKAGLKIQREASYQRVIVQDDDDDNLSLSPFTLLSQSITLLSFRPPPLRSSPLLSIAVSHILLIFLPPCSHLLAQTVRVSWLYLRGAVSQGEAGG